MGPPSRSGPGRIQHQFLEDREGWIRCRSAETGAQIGAVHTQDAKRELCSRPPSGELGQIQIGAGRQQAVVDRNLFGVAAGIEYGTASHVAKNLTLVVGKQVSTLIIQTGASSVIVPGEGPARTPVAG